MKYTRDEDGEKKDVNIEGTYQTHDEAWRASKGCLLDRDDGITNISFAEYDEAQAGEKDCGFGEDFRRGLACCRREWCELPRPNGEGTGDGGGQIGRLAEADN